MNDQNKVCLVILDGWGHSKKSCENQKHFSMKPLKGLHLDAITQAKTPFYDEVLIKHGFMTLCASGLAVGLPENTMGNSQVGHITIGAGRCVQQPLLKIGNMLKNGEIAQILKSKGLLAKIKNDPTRLHLIGLASDGGVHSHIDHLLQLMNIFSDCQVYDEIVLHLITDGRDTRPMSCLKYIKEVFNLAQNINNKTNSELIKIGSIAGRWYTMDRDNNRQRYESAFRTMTERSSVSNGPFKTDFSKIEEHVLSCYQKVPSDEMISPFEVVSDSTIKKQDLIFFFNFRTDRMKQITAHFSQSGYKNLFTITDYGLNDNAITVIIRDEAIQDTLAEIISKNELRQVHIAETEKFAHVTYFLNGGCEQAFKGEERILIESDKIESFKDRPIMKAHEITTEALKKMDENIPFMVLNYANADMVGHTGDFEATVAACETIDNCLGNLARYARNKDYNMLITADHGNAEIMADENGAITRHTTSRVPFIAIGKYIKLKSFHKNPKMADSLTLSSITPTVLKIMNISKPEKMTGTSLIEFKHDKI